MSDTLTSIARVDASHVGSFFSTLSPTRHLLHQPGGRLRAGQPSRRDRGHRWRLGAVHLRQQRVRRRRDQRAGCSRRNTGGLTNAISASPRTYGLNLTKRF
ncbi:hypothetical protein AB5I41_11395 [Sphingomonas sp. MMS24-JH45]